MRPTRSWLGWMAAACVGLVMGVASAEPHDPYPFPPDSEPGGALCAVKQGCTDRDGFGTCSQCCTARCDDSNNCHNACWNIFCRFKPNAPGCPVVGS